MRLEVRLRRWRRQRMLRRRAQRAERAPRTRQQMMQQQRRRASAALAGSLTVLAVAAVCVAPVAYQETFAAVSDTEVAREPDDLHAVRRFDGTTNHDTAATNPITSPAPTSIVGQTQTQLSGVSIDEVQDADGDFPEYPFAGHPAASQAGSNGIGPPPFPLH